VEILRHILRYVHLVGFATLFGAFVVQYLSGAYRVNLAMRIGLGTTIGAGLLLAIPFPAGIDLDYAKLGVKLLIAVVIGASFGVTVTRERAGKEIARGLFLTIGGLILLNAAVAVFWR